MNRIDRHFAALRRMQAESVMPKVGALLDIWEQMPNDESQLLRKEYPHLYDAIKALNAAVEETEK